MDSEVILEHHQRKRFNKHKEIPMRALLSIVEDKYRPVAQHWKGLIVSSLIQEGISDGSGY